jgi:hemoglobin
MSGPLFERIGGQAAIMAAVDLFYEKVLADPELSSFFAGLDMSAQVKKQIAFMSWAFDGPSQYRGRDLGAAHAHLVQKLGLNDRHFDLVAAHLASTLLELNVPGDVASEALGRVAALRNVVLGR